MQGTCLRWTLNKNMRFLLNPTTKPCVDQKGLAKCFHWAIHEAYLTRDNLQRRKFILPNRCVLHLRIQNPPTTYYLAASIFGRCAVCSLNIFGLPWTMPGSVREQHQNVRKGRELRRKMEMWRTIPSCILSILEIGKKGITKFFKQAANICFIVDVCRI